LWLKNDANVGAMYLGAVGWIAAAAVSPGYIGSKGHQSTDKRAIRDQDAADRERLKKKMENPKECFQREAAKAAAARAGRPATEPNPEVMEAAREFNEARAADKEGSKAQDASKS
jgi:hypothetical protein